MENMLVLFLLKYIANNIGDRDLEEAFDIRRSGSTERFGKECKVFEGSEFKPSKRTEFTATIYDGLIVDVHATLKHMRRNLEVKANIEATDLKVRKVAPFRMADIFSLIEANEQKITRRNMNSLDEAIAHLKSHSKVPCEDECDDDDECDDEDFFTTRYCSSGVGKLKRMMKYKYFAAYRIGWGLTNDGMAYEYRKESPTEIKILQYESKHARKIGGFYHYRVYYIKYPKDFDFYDERKKQMQNM